MKIALERHAYAPEMNRAHLFTNRGRPAGSLPAPGCGSIAEARKALFAPVAPCRIVEATKARPAPWAGLNRTVRAAYPLEPGNMVTIRAHCRRVQTMPGPLRREGAAILNDGRTLPASRLIVRTRLGSRPAR